jgi:glycerol uptake operon antiterminator
MLNFEDYPIIAAVKSESDFSAALLSGVEAIFMLSSDILTVQCHADKAHECGKKLFVHMDFVEGLSKDASGVRYIATKNIDGLISTRSNVISVAAELGITSVQRFFVIDSRSVDTALESLRSSKADMIEIMPGIAYKAIERINARVSIPIIAGGLIDQKEEIINLHSTKHQDSIGSPHS